MRSAISREFWLDQWETEAGIKLLSNVHDQSEDSSETAERAYVDRKSKCRIFLVLTLQSIILFSFIDFKAFFMDYQK